MSAENRGPWGPWATVGWGLLVMVAFVGVQTAVVVGLTVVRQVPLSPHDGLAVALSTLASGVVGTALVLLIALARRGAPLGESLGLRRLSWLGVFVSVVLGLTVTAIGDGILVLLDVPVVPPFMVEVWRTSPSLVLLLLAVVVVAPVFEEILFRGLLLSGLARSRLGAPGAVVLTALAWAGIHGQYTGTYLALVFAMGIVLGVVRTASGSVVPGMVMHAVTNLVATVEVAAWG